MSNPAQSAEELLNTSASEEAVKTEPARGEVSAQTIARLMGLPTQSDLKLLDGKLDLLVSRLGTISVRLEKVGQAVAQAPSVNDMERIDVQIGSLRSSMRELLLALRGMVTQNPDAKDKLDQAQKELETLPEGFDQK